MPGFGDNRGKGVTQQLINCYLTHRVFDLHKSVKLFFTLNYSDLIISNKGSNALSVIK
jgi:hypothetical protein